MADDPEQHTEHEPPVIDVSPALHIAGHEAELLGLDGVPDTAPVLHERDGENDDPNGDPVHRVGTDIATRGVGYHE